MSVEENAKIDEENIASWSARDADRTLAQFADDAVWQDVGVPEPMRGKAAMRPYVQSWFTAFPDLTARVTNRVVTEDQVATELEFTGPNTGPMQMSPGHPAIPPTGRTVNGKGTYFMRIRNGKIVEFHSYPDVAA